MYGLNTTNIWEYLSDYKYYPMWISMGYCTMANGQTVNCQTSNFSVTQPLHSLRAHNMPALAQKGKMPWLFVAWLEGFTCLKQLPLPAFIWAPVCLVKLLVHTLLHQCHIYC